MNKHQIVGLAWRHKVDHLDQFDVYAKSDAKGWFCYRRPDGRLGMIHRDGLLTQYERQA